MSGLFGDEPAAAPPAFDHAFEGIVGHPGPLRILSTALAAGRVPHAYLFAGPPGVGKTTAADRLARALLCSGPGQRPCGACADCGRAAHGNAYNRLDIAPDGAQIKITQIRAMTELIATGPERGVVVLGPAETMHEHAANALLKTLEEPRKGWTLILVADAVEALLPTIRSRCQLVRFGRLGDAECTHVLARNGIAAAHLETVSRLAQGAPGALLAMGLSGVELVDDYRAAVGVLQPEALQSVEGLLAAAEAWGSDLDGTRRFLLWAQVWTSGALAAAHGAAPDPAAAAWAAAFPASFPPRFAQRLEEVAALLDRNINRQTAIEELLIMLRQARRRSA